MGMTFTPRTSLPTSSGFASNIPLKINPTTFEVHIIAQRSSQIAGSNDDEIMLLIQS